MNPSPLMDCYGYPAEETEKVIREWGNDWLGLMDYVRAAWWMPDWGWTQSDTLNDLGLPVRRYEISTGGWSGNESLISAMEGNRMFQMFCWVQSRRGGHYIYEVRTPETETL